jgi:hypothetical protein
MYKVHCALLRLALPDFGGFIHLQKKICLFSTTYDGKSQEVLCSA